MKYSNTLFKTSKGSKEYDSKNATYLVRGGFVSQVMSGVYAYLPLGLRVIRNIETIVRDEMDKIGEEMQMPALAPKETWQTTNRLNTVDVLMKTSPANEVSKAKNSSEYILNPTHEDVTTSIVKQYGNSYKNLPIALYQIQTKFRNEPRAKSGLLRMREFRMKDLYSFHASKEDFEQYYEESKKYYMNVMKRVGIGNYTYLALASGGDFTENFSHEFQVRLETGEDWLFHVESTGVTYNREVAPSKAPEFEGNAEESERKLEDVYGEEITGMEELVKFLDVPAQKCVKTLIYKADDRVIVAAVRGDYDVNEIKLKKVVGAKQLELADEATVKEVTGAEIGYAGIINLPDSVELYLDDSIEPMRNFECGTNKTNYHTINVNWGRDIDKPEQFYDIKLAKEGDIHPESGEVYELFKSSEAGNIFPLETKFTSAFKYEVVDEAGKSKPIYMGSYGIGISRMMGIIAELFNDENGVIWPISVAPYHMQLITLDKDEQILKKAEAAYDELIGAGLQVLWDDREDASPGVKFADADLIGNPIRVVISKRSLENGGAEVKQRREDSSEVVALDKLLGRLQEIKKNLESELTAE
ncbi:MAG: proline--tRNA ligase [Candidatus Dojkabacteria bacterium]|nr:MAG: proline--tRNA ligase [Candidatus Dojkabacteria bacterium]